MKNLYLGFFTPYTVRGQQRNYIPDFLCHVDLLNLIVEVSGERDKEKKAKVATLWVPAVNNAGTWGRWAFVEIGGRWDAATTIRAILSGLVILNAAGPT